MAMTREEFMAMSLPLIDIAFETARTNKRSDFIILGPTLDDLSAWAPGVRRIFGDDQNEVSALLLPYPDMSFKELLKAVWEEVQTRMLPDTANYWPTLFVALSHHAEDGSIDELLQSVTLLDHLGTSGYPLGACAFLPRMFDDKNSLFVFDRQSLAAPSTDQFWRCDYESSQAMRRELIHQGYSQSDNRVDDGYSIREQRPTAMYELTQADSGHAVVAMRMSGQHNLPTRPSHYCRLSAQTPGGAIRGATAATVGSKPRSDRDYFLPADLLVPLPIDPVEVAYSWRQRLLRQLGAPIVPLGSIADVLPAQGTEITPKDLVVSMVTKSWHSEEGTIVIEHRYYSENSENAQRLFLIRCSSPDPLLDSIQSSRGDMQLMCAARGTRTCPQVLPSDLLGLEVPWPSEKNREAYRSLKNQFEDLISDIQSIGADDIHRMIKPPTMFSQWNVALDRTRTLRDELQRVVDKAMLPDGLPTRSEPPPPIALNWTRQRYLEERNAQQRLNLSFDYFEVLIRTEIATLSGTLFDGQPDQLRSLLVNCFRQKVARDGALRLTLGDWCSLGSRLRDEVRKRIGASGSSPPQWPTDSFTKSACKVVDDLTRALVEKRNSFRGHGVVPTESLASAELRHVEPMVERLGSHMHHLNRWEMAAPQHLSPRPSGMVVSAYALNRYIGEFPRCDILVERSSNLANFGTDEVFGSPGGARWFSMAPWILFGACDESGERFPLYLDKIERDSLHYACLLPGRNAKKVPRQWAETPRAEYVDLSEH